MPSVSEKQNALSAMVLQEDCMEKLEVRFNRWNLSLCLYIMGSSLTWRHLFPNAKPCHIYEKIILCRINIIYTRKAYIFYQFKFYLVAFYSQKHLYSTTSIFLYLCIYLCICKFIYYQHSGLYSGKTKWLILKWPCLPCV